MATLRDTFDTIDPLPTDSLDGWSLPAWTYSDPDFYAAEMDRIFRPSWQVACHDSDIAKLHMESNGASIYVDRATALGRAEQCMFCHKPDSAFGLGIKAVHDK